MIAGHKPGAQQKGGVVLSDYHATQGRRLVDMKYYAASTEKVHARYQKYSDFVRDQIGCATPPRSGWILGDEAGCD
jgi:hypothetical protein